MIINKKHIDFFKIVNESLNYLVIKFLKQKY